MNESFPVTPALEFEALFEEFVGRIERGEFRHPHLGGLFHETMGPLQALIALYVGIKLAREHPPVASRMRGKLWRHFFGEELRTPMPDQEDAAARFRRCWLAMAVVFGLFKCVELKDACLRTAETWNPDLRTDELGAWVVRVEKLMHLAREGSSAAREAAWHSGPIED